MDLIEIFQIIYDTGDWLWPAIWMMPRNSVYGGWPRSGEIDLVESRGNRQLYSGNTHVGTQQIGSTMHFGPSPDVRKIMRKLNYLFINVY